MWDVEYFTWQKGRRPVEVFIDSLDPVKDQPYIMNMFRRLSVEGNKMREPDSSPLGDGLFELKVTTENNRFRFFYFFGKNSVIVLTNGAKKKKWRLDHEVELARKYKRIYLESRKK